MIPVNNVNQEAVAQQQEQQFNEEIERLETAIFAEKWNQKTLKNGQFTPEYISTPFLREYKDITVSDKHWERIIADIKAAGYVVYRKWYHNTYFGYTKLYEVLGAKARFTDSQRLEMNYQDEWSRPWGPGGEQWKAELV